MAWQVSGGHWLNASYSRIRGENDDMNEPLFRMPADEVSLGWIGQIMPGVKGDFTLRLVDEQKRVATRFTNGTENRTAGFVTADLEQPGSSRKTRACGWQSGILPTRPIMSI